MIEENVLSRFLLSLNLEVQSKLDGGEREGKLL